jgi:hypothetical protein
MDSQVGALAARIDADERWFANSCPPSIYGRGLKLQRHRSFCDDEEVPAPKVFS